MWTVIKYKKHFKKSEKDTIQYIVVLKLLTHHSVHNNYSQN